MVVEIIAGVIVLILAIIGIAKLAQRRSGGGGSVDIEGVMKMASNSKKALAQALYNPEKMGAAFEYLQKTAAVSKRAIRALARQGRITRGRVDAAMARYNLPREDAMDYLDSLLEIYNVAGLAATQYKRGHINAEEFRNYVAGEMKRQEAALKSHYALRRKGFD